MKIEIKFELGEIVKFGNKEAIIRVIKMDEVNKYTEMDGKLFLHYFIEEIIDLNSLGKIHPSPFQGWVYEWELEEKNRR